MITPLRIRLFSAKPREHDYTRKQRIKAQGRMRYVILLREKDGLIFREIGVTIGTSMNRAREIYCHAARIRNARKSRGINFSEYRTGDTYADFKAHYDAAMSDLPDSY